MNAKEFVDDLKKLVTNRSTYYSNHFPENCGMVHGNGVLSFDCIGMVKSVINDPTIVDRYNPVGFYVIPGQVVPDISEYGILSECDSVKWGFFDEAVVGAYLYMSGHAGIFIGGLGNVNVIECTYVPTWGANGVVCSWVDADGTRRDQKNGTIIGRWEAWGKLSKWINYSYWYKKNGEWYYSDKTGWLWDKNYQAWFLIADDGKMLTGWHCVKGKWYYMDPENGEMLTGWLLDQDGRWYYLGSDGAMLTGWVKDRDYWYYLYPKTADGFKCGEMVTGTVMIGGKPYKFDASGHWMGD